jgi:hypothetical protein
MKIKLTPEQKFKHDLNNCITDNCTKKNAAGSNYCFYHKAIKYRQNNPQPYAYNVYRQNQKKANRVALTYAEYILKPTKKCQTHNP